MPTYNRLRHLRPAVDSVWAQTFTDWELIVADDGSDGETAEYVATLADCPRIRVLRLPHSGNPGLVRNAACRLACGELVAFLDSDDVWLPQKLAMQVASLRIHPQRLWSHTAFALMGEGGERLTGVQGRQWPATEGWILEPLIRMRASIAIASVVVRRGSLEQLGGFDPGLVAGNDYDLYLRLARLSEVDGIPEILLHKRLQRQPYYDDRTVAADIMRALEKALATSTNVSERSVLRRERARWAAALARSHALHGMRWAALRTLATTLQHSWAYREWWQTGGEAAVRAVAPASVLRLVRSLVGRPRIQDPRH